MTNKPLQYESLKTVLQHMEPNSRFQIANACPSIRKTEKVVPLRINKLAFTSTPTRPFKVIVNSIEYVIETVRVYPPGVQIPNQERNESFGTDFDQFGFKDLSSNAHITPGDIVIGLPEHVARDTEDDLVEQNERFIQTLETILAMEQNGERIPEHLRHVIDPIDHLRFGEFHMQPTWRLQNAIQQRRTWLLPFYNRRYNTPTPFSTVVQLTVKSKHGTEIFQRFPGKKVYQVAKRFTTFLFGNRKPINVSFFRSTCFNSVLRLPPGLSIVTKHVQANQGAYLCSMLSPLFHASSFPLDRLKTTTLNVRGSIPDMIKSARELSILKISAMSSFLRNVTNRVVEVRNASITSPDYLSLAQKWVETRRPVGTCYTFGVEERNTSSEAMELISRRLNGKRVENNIKVPLSELSELQLSLKETPTGFYFRFEVIAI